MLYRRKAAWWSGDFQLSRWNYVVMLQSVMRRLSPLSGLLESCAINNVGAHLIDLRKHPAFSRPVVLLSASNIRTPCLWLCNSAVSESSVYIAVQSALSGQCSGQSVHAAFVKFGVSSLAYNKRLVREGRGGLGREGASGRGRERYRLS